VPERTPGGQGWGLIALLLVAANLRPAVTVVGPVLDDIRADMGLSAAAAGALTTIPLVFFGLAGPLTPPLRRRLGDERLVFGALGALAAGILMRSGAGLAGLFAGSALLGLGIGVCNIVVPGLVKRDHPERISHVTAIYIAAMIVGATASAALVVPLAGEGGWRLAIGSLALPAALAALVWSSQLSRRTTAPAAVHRVAGLWRDRTAWQLTAFMGLQSLTVYVVFTWLPTICHDRGMSVSTAALVLSLSILVQAVGSLLVPAAMGRFRDQRTIVAVVTAAAFVGFAGIGWAPIASAWLWAVILGLSHGAGFSLALSLMGLRAHDHHVAVSLSGMAQTVGYLLAAIGPFGVGALHDLTGGWGVPTLVLLTLVALQAVVGMGVGRARLVGARSVPVLPVV
jgi:CP family cyanate transporter-like MFS transporter